MDLIEADPSFTHLSTGNLLREAVQAETPVGLEAKAYMDKGELVPDEVIMKIVSELVEADPDDARYIFDGFPRTLEQARLLDRFIDSSGNGKLTHVLVLEVPHDLIVERIAGRLICRECGMVYQIKNMPPKVEGVCDVCGGELYQRPDDNRETVLNRLDVYEKQTASLIEYYEQREVLRRIDASERKSTLHALLEQIAPAS